MGGRTVTTRVWFLEMTAPGQLVAPARDAPAGLALTDVAPVSAAYVRFLYAAVGRDFAWTDRLHWSESRWQDHLAQPGVRLLTAAIGGAPAGFALLVPGRDTTEIEAAPENQVEVEYFGLLPGWMGRGIGGALLYRAVQTAWDAGAARVWLHTCSLDSPDALPAYERRGFRVYRQETREQQVTDRSAPW